MENVKELTTDQIILPPNNMREYIDRDAIFELAEDIAKNGLISPITVRPKDGAFELVAGQRRLLAHRYGGIIKIKCIVKELTDEEALALMTSENLSRVDVNPVDEAKHIKRLMDVSENDIKKVMHIVGRGEKWVRDRIAIGEMPDYMQEAIGEKVLKIGVALILIQITDENTRRLWTMQAIRDGVSIDMANYWLADFKRQLLPGGDLNTDNGESVRIEPPKAVMLECSVSGQKYDARVIRSVFIAEENLQYFYAFCDAFRNAPAEINSPPA